MENLMLLSVLLNHQNHKFMIEKSKKFLQYFHSLEVLLEQLWLLCFFLDHIPIFLIKSQLLCKYLRLMILKNKKMWI